MAVTLLGTTTADSSGNNVGSPPAGSNRLLIVCDITETNAADTVTAVTIGGVSVPSGRIYQKSNTTMDVFVYILNESEIASMSGTAVSRTGLTPGSFFMMTAQYFQGVDQTTPYTDTQEVGYDIDSANSTGTQTYTLDEVLDGLGVVFAGDSKSGGTWGYNGGYAQLGAIYDDGALMDSVIATKTISANASAVSTAVTNSLTGDKMCMFAIMLLPAGGGGPSAISGDLLPVTINVATKELGVTPATKGMMHNDTADSGGELSYLLTTPVSTGTLVPYLDGKFTYTPPAGFTGQATFGYTLYEYGVAKQEVTIYIIVEEGVVVAITENGYLTNSTILASVVSESAGNLEPATTNLSDFTSHVDTAITWTHGSIPASDTMYVNGSTASRGSLAAGYARDDFVHYDSGGYMVYQKALAYKLLADTDYADNVIALIDELVELTDLGTPLSESARYNGGNQWVLHCATSLPLWIQSADLIAGYSGWTTAKYQTFQTWLATEVYKYVSWASHNRKNNWGSASSLLCWMIADYVDDSYITSLTETVLTGGSAVGSQYDQSPANAKATHKQLQLDRMGTTEAMDSAEPIYGIQSYGGIPDELRRGSGEPSGTTYASTSVRGSDDTIDTTARDYQIKQIQHLLFHAECLYRRGDTSLYDFEVNGVPALLQAIYFVIENPTDVNDSAPWESNSNGVLYVAYKYYKNQILKTNADLYSTTKSGAELPYGRFTHHLNSPSKYFKGLIGTKGWFRSLVNKVTMISSLIRQ